MIQKICKLFVLIVILQLLPLLPFKATADLPSKSKPTKVRLIKPTKVPHLAAMSSSDRVRSTFPPRVNVTRGGKGGESVRAEGSPVRFNKRWTGQRDGARSGKQRYLFLRRKHRRSDRQCQSAARRRRCRRCGHYLQHQNRSLYHQRQHEIGCEIRFKTGRVSVVIQPSSTQKPNNPDAV